VVGCGNVGAGYDAMTHGDPPLSHAGSYHREPRTRLVAGADLDVDARQRFSETWNAPAYATAEAAVGAAERPLVSICTPPEGRLDLVHEVLAARPRAIWIEKPLAATAAEGEAIVEACRSAAVPLQLNFQRRFDPAHIRLAERLKVAQRPLHADFRFSGSYPNYGSHALDLFRWLVGTPVEVRLLAVGGSEPIAWLRTEDGSTGTFARLNVEPALLFDVDVRGPDVRVTITAMGEQVVVGNAERSPLHRHVLRTALQPPAIGTLDVAFANALRSLLDHLEADAPLRCRGEDGVAALALIEAILKGPPA